MTTAGAGLRRSLAAVLARSDRRVAAEVAAAYLPRVKGLLARGPRSDWGREIRVAVKEGETGSPTREEIIDLARRSHGVQPPDLLALCTAPNTLRGQFAAELNAECRRLQETAELLGAVSAGRELARREPLLEATHPDDVLEELADLALRGTDVTEAVRLLSSCVRCVALAGLAEITGAPEPRAASVAARIATKSSSMPWTRGGWGSGCCAGTRTCRSACGWSSGCGADDVALEVGVRRRRSVLAANALPQAGQRGMPRPTTRCRNTAPRRQHRNGPYPLGGAETKSRPRKPRVFKG